MLIIQCNIDAGLQTDIIFLDLSKAFDSVPHNLLLLKLQGFGINGHLLSWFSDYLNNRKQRVVLNGYSSKYLKVYSGVPQGSILGPLLFNLYINDITDNLPGANNLYMYADD